MIEDVAHRNKGMELTFINDVAQVLEVFEGTEVDLLLLTMFSKSVENFSSEVVEDRWMACQKVEDRAEQTGRGVPAGDEDVEQLVSQGFPVPGLSRERL